MKLDILAIGVHPDDVELSCAGTLLRQIDLGYTVGVLDLTLGELGTRGNAQIRTQEAMASAQLMGAVVREQLDLEDGFFTQNRDNLLKVIRAIRKYRPDIVLMNALEDRHPDHGRAAKLSADACFLSGLVKIETLDTEGGKQMPWRPKAVYHYIQDRALKPDFAVDISDYIDKKFELIMAYKSQFYDPNSDEPMTPIASQSFLESVRGKDSVYGRYIGVTYAEGYNVARTVGVKDLFDLI
ncbi:MAG: bacillithiol biosynthesis deacetylase BshB1 [Saprospiraceae bacterium]|nr:bacillithiol biosynthesis deacetylase BshB1 [Saprospiraceae bacterium]